MTRQATTRANVHSVRPRSRASTACSSDRAHFATYRLTAYDSKRPPWIFHHDRTRRHHVAGARIASFYRAERNAAARAKLPEGFRLHDLRHRRVTTWLADGKGVVHVKEAVGHADLRTTMGYTHLAREHLRSLVAPASAQAIAQAKPKHGLG